MKMIEGYIGRTLYLHIAAVLFVLLALYFFSTLISELGMVGKGHYTMVDAVLYSLKLLPRQAYELFPLVALVGTILGIGSLASSNELTVLRAAGVSIRRLALAVMKSGLVLIVLVIVMGDTVAPYLEKQAHAKRLAAMAKSVSVNSENGLWARDGDDYINIRVLIPGGQAKDITRYRFDGQQLTEVAYSASGTYLNNGWLVRPVSKTLFQGDSVVAQVEEEEHWQSSLTPDVVNVATMVPENLALMELFEFIDYLHQNGLAAQRYETAMWVRLFNPLATGGMILLALPFVFGSLRAVSIGQRVMVGSMIGIVFYLVNGMFSRLGLIYDIAPMVSAGVPTLLVYVIWFQLMRRVH